MIKFIKVVVLGLILVAISDFVIGSILRHYYFSQSSGIYYRTTVAMDSTRADLLVFGTSRAYHHYAAKTIEDSLGISSYNTGRDGEYIFFQTAIFKSVLKRYKPKMVVLDFAGTFDHSQGDYDRLAALLPYYADHPEIHGIIGQKSRFEKYKLLSHIYPYNSSILTIIAGNMEFNKDRESNADYHGYVPLNGIMYKELDSVKTPAYYDIDTNKIAAFNEFLNLAKQNGIPLIVVNSPDYYLYESDYSLELVSKRCKELGIPFADFSKDPDFLTHNNYFEDPTHLNEHGATMFTKKVLGLIRQQNVFKAPAQ